MHAVFIALYIGIGIVQICATVKGIQYYFDVSTFVAAFGGLVVSYIPFIGAIAGIWGAIHGWGWHWWQAVLLFMWQPIIYMFVSGTISIFSFVQRPQRNTEEIASIASNSNNFENNAPAKSNKNILKKLFHGEFSLPMSYWIFGVFASLVWNYSFKFITYLFQSRTDFAVVYTRNFGMGGVKVLFLSIMLLFYGYTVISLVGQWRSATRYQGPKVWAYAVKVIICIAWILLVSSVVYVIDFINM